MEVDVQTVLGQNWTTREMTTGCLETNSQGNYLLKFRLVQNRQARTGTRRIVPRRPGITGLLVGEAEGECQHLSAGDIDMANDQGWVCRLCGMDLINGEELHRHHTITASQRRLGRASQPELVHLFCHQQETRRQFGEGQG